MNCLASQPHAQPNDCFGSGDGRESPGSERTSSDMTSGVIVALLLLRGNGRLEKPGFKAQLALDGLLAVRR